MTLHERFRQLAALINVDVKLVVDEKKALQGRTHARGRAERRAFACTNGETVWVRPKLLGADAQRRDGVLMHELAHCWCIQNGHAEHTESECDAVAKELFGATIRYDDDDVQTIGEGVTPRPAYLPNPAPVWFHGGSVDDVAQVKALGHFPADYTPVRGNFGSGVYLTSSKTEAKKFGDVVISVSVHPAVKLLDMRDPTYRAMPSTVFDHLVSARAKTAFEVRWQEGDLPGAVVAGATADGYGGLIWKGDAWNDWAVIFDPTQVLLASKPRKARANPDDYRGSHKPSGRDYGAPLHDVEVMMPDYYAHPEWYQAWYAAMDKAATRIILGARGKPSKTVTVYRAVPLDVQSINPGDWVTTVKAYAQAHIMNALNGRGHILSTTAAAQDLFTSGDSHLEWGWHPSQSDDVEKTRSRLPKTAFRTVQKHNPAPSPRLLPALDYYNDPGVRALHHALKGGSEEAAQRMAQDMAPHVPEDAVLIPMPSRKGHGGAGLLLAQHIADITGRPLLDVLRGRSRPSLYVVKKRGGDPRSVDLGLHLSERLPESGTPVIVDNIVGTGHTARSALRVIPGAVVLVHAVDRGIAAVVNPAPPQLVQSDLEDAIQHADLYGDQGWTIDDFNIKYLGELPLSLIRRFEDWGAWIDVAPEDFAGMSTEERLAELASFRGPAWAQRAATWLKDGVPPIVVIDAPMEVDYALHEQIGDGRGRINFALAMGLKKLPVVRMVWKHKLAPKPT